jgi:hypothetical protein
MTTQTCESDVAIEIPATQSADDTRVLIEERIKESLQGIAKIQERLMEKSGLKP